MDTERAELETEERLRIAERDRAHRAERILKDELTRDALQAVRDQAWRTFTTSDPKDVDGLQRARLQYMVAEDFANTFIQHVETGKMASEQLTFIQRQLERWRKRAA